jgi:hypothetical protein
VRTLMGPAAWVHHNQIYVADAKTARGGFPQLDQCFGGQRNGLCGGARFPVPDHRPAAGSRLADRAAAGEHADANLRLRCLRRHRPAPAGWVVLRWIPPLPLIPPFSAG